MEMACLPLELPAEDRGGKQDMTSAVIRFWTQFLRKSVFSSSAIPRKTTACKVELGSRERQRWGRSCRGWLGGHSYFPVSLGSNQMVAFCVRSEEPGPSPPRLPGPASGLCLQAATGSVFQLLLPRLERSLGNPDLYC